MNTIQYNSIQYNTIQYNTIQLKILLAEDDQDDRDFFDRVLKEIPIPTQLINVCEGEQLMDYLYKNSEHLPNVLFLDINMPRKNGIECLCEIKDDEKLKDLPVVMFSTSFPRDCNYEKELINRLMKIGAHDFIRKSNNLVQLKECIHQVIKRVADKQIP